MLVISADLLLAIPLLLGVLLIADTRWWPRDGGDPTGSG
jgi:hypothetical protein